MSDSSCIKTRRNIRNTNYGILLSVSLLGLSSSNALSMSAIISCWLILAMRWCLLCPSAAVSPGWLKELQPKVVKVKTNKATTKTTLHTESETLFIMSPCYRPEQIFIIWAEQNIPLITNQLYKLPELLSTKNVPKWVRKYVKKKGFSCCTREMIIKKGKNL